MEKQERLHLDSVKSLDEHFIENPGIEKILRLLEEDNVLTFQPQYFKDKEETEENLYRYSITLKAYIPKADLLRVDSTEFYRIFKPHQNALLGEETVQFQEYEGMGENTELDIMKAGEIYIKHAIEWQESESEKVYMLAFIPVTQLPIAERGSSKSFNELYYISKYSYTFFDFLEDVKAAPNSLPRMDLADTTPRNVATISETTRAAINDFLRPFYEEEQIELEIKRAKREPNLSLFGEVPETLSEYPPINKPSTLIISDPKVRGLIPYYRPENPNIIDGQMKLKLFPQNKDPEAYTFLSIENIDGVDFSKPIEVFDLIILDAAITLLEKQGYFTESQIFDLVLTPGTKPNQARKKETREILYKLANTNATIKTGEAKDKRGKIKMTSTSGRLLCVFIRENIPYRGNFTTLYVEDGGKHLLYEHAKQCGNFIKNMPLELLASASTTYMIILHNVLFKQLNATIYGKRMDHYIKLETIAEKCGIDFGSGANARNKKKLLRGSIDIILEDWKAKGFVVSHEWRRTSKDKGAYLGVTIYASKEYLTSHLKTTGPLIQG